MKRLIGLVCIFAALLTSAARAETLVCDARELIAGGNGTRGTIGIDMNSLTIQWLESEENLLSSETFCGIALPASARCQLIKYPVKFTPGFRVNCIDGTLNPEKVVFARAFFVRSEVTRNGRFYCQVDGEESVRKVVEFSGCTPTSL